MKFPNHILLDITKPCMSESTEYWVFNYLKSFDTYPEFYSNLKSPSNFRKNIGSLYNSQFISKQKKFTLIYSRNNPSLSFSLEKIKKYNHLYNERLKVKNRDVFSRHNGKVVFDYLNKFFSKTDKRLLNKQLHNLHINLKLSEHKSNYLWEFFDINFLRKEKIYTKLKYSRVPQYDIVSGGVAALFSGFLGFLICEKFGFELLDSGDFYFFFMYIVFCCFFLRLIVKLSSNLQDEWNPLSIKWILFYCKTIFRLTIRRIVNFKTKWINY